jgi:hypothetical protein
MVRFRHGIPASTNSGLFQHTGQMGLPEIRAAASLLQCRARTDALAGCGRFADSRGVQGE